MDRFDDCEVTIGNAERFVGRGELYAIAHGELALDLSVDADAREAPRIVSGKLSVRLFDRELVVGRVELDDRCIGSSLDSDSFAATCVANYVVNLVAACPRSF